MPVQRHSLHWGEGREKNLSRIFYNTFMWSHRFLLMFFLIPGKFCLWRKNCYYHIFVLYLIGYFFGDLGLCNSLKNDSICYLIGNCFWLSIRNNGILVLTSPKICNLLTGKWSASSDSLNFFNKTNQHAFQVSREVTCNSANLFKIFVGYFT